MKNLHHSLKAVRQRAKRLQSKVNQIIENEPITLQPNVAEDLAQIVEDVSPENSPEIVFWGQQRAYNRLKDKHQTRWQSLYALNLKYMSSSDHQAVCQSGIKSTLRENTGRLYFITS